MTNLPFPFRLPDGALGLAAVTMLLALTACGEIASAEPARQANPLTTKPAAQPEPPAREEVPEPLRPPLRAGERPGDPVTPTLLVGRWTDNGRCEDAITFSADGSFVAPTGGRGRWRIEGDRLILQGTTTLAPRLHLMQRNAIMLSHPNGLIGVSERCVPVGEG